MSGSSFACIRSKKSKSRVGVAVESNETIRNIMETNVTNVTIT